MSFENKVIAYKKLEIMKTYEDTDTSEYAKYKSWMDSLLSIPFGTYNDSSITTDSELNDIRNYIKNVRNVLDEKLSFLEKPKDQIINLTRNFVFWQAKQKSPTFCKFQVELFAKTALCF